MIKALDEVPQTLQEKRQSYRDMIRADIAEAVENHIDKFEFDGDYNYKYLAGYAREEARMYYARYIFRPVASEVRKALEKIFPEEHYYCIPDYWEWERKHPFFKVKSLKGEDRTHVYCEIDYSVTENFYEELLKAAEEREKDYQKRKAKREQIRNAERAKHEKG